MLKSFDLPGTFVFLPAVILMLLALQWGGTSYAWSDARIISLIVIAGVLGIIFVAIEIWMQEDALIPPRLLMLRSVWSSSAFSVCLAAELFVILYYVGSLGRIVLYFLDPNY
jgi:hypothetical protein